MKNAFVTVVGNEHGMTGPQVLAHDGMPREADLRWFAAIDDDPAAMESGNGTAFFNAAVLKDFQAENGPVRHGTALDVEIGDTNPRNWVVTKIKGYNLTPAL